LMYPYNRIRMGTLEASILDPKDIGSASWGYTFQRKLLDDGHKSCVKDSKESISAIAVEKSAVQRLEKRIHTTGVRPGLADSTAAQIDATKGYGQLLAYFDEVTAIYTQQHADETAAYQAWNDALTSSITRLQRAQDGVESFTDALKGFNIDAAEQILQIMEGQGFGIRVEANPNALLAYAKRMSSDASNMQGTAKGMAEVIKGLEQEAPKLDDVMSSLKPFEKRQKIADATIDLDTAIGYISRAYSSQ